MTRKGRVTFSRCRVIESTDTVDPKTGNLHVQIPVVASTNPKQQRAMHKGVESVLLLLSRLGFYGGVPALMVWGWVRWLKRMQPRTVPAILS